MTLYLVLSKIFEGFHFTKNEYGFCIVLGWITFGASLLHAGHAVSSAVDHMDLMVEEILLLQSTLREASPEKYEELYGFSLNDLNDLLDTDPKDE